jgi:hypothetical protein
MLKSVYVYSWIYVYEICGWGRREFGGKIGGMYVYMYLYVYIC